MKVIFPLILLMVIFFPSDGFSSKPNVSLQDRSSDQAKNMDREKEQPVWDDREDEWFEADVDQSAWVEGNPRSQSRVKEIPLLIELEYKDAPNPKELKRLERPYPDIKEDKLIIPKNKKILEDPAGDEHDNPLPTPEPPSPPDNSYVDVIL